MSDSAGFAPSRASEHSLNDVIFYQTYAHAFARIFVRPLIGTWVRPNHLTGLRLMTGLAACASLGVGTRLTARWSAVLWLISCVLDRADAPGLGGWLRFWWSQV